MRRMLLFLGTILIFVLGFGMSVLAFSMEDKYTDQETYRQMETEYIQAAKEVLLEKGCKHAGITLTYITDKDGNRDYTLMLHHRKIDRMDDIELALLQARLEEQGEIYLLGQVKMVKILSDR